MLVLSRKVGEKIVLGDKITITINRISGHRVSLGIEAPAGVKIVRSELPPIAVSTHDHQARSATDVGFSPSDEFKHSSTNGMTNHAARLPR
jgi:carbon storage regulator CsrA